VCAVTVLQIALGDYIVTKKNTDAEIYDVASDRPIERRGQDLLGRRSFAEKIASVILRRGGRDSFVISMQGPWGSGKSSLKNMILDALREDTQKCPHIIEFAPWQFRDADTLFSAFFHEIAIEIGKEGGEVHQQRAERMEAYGKRLALGGSTIKAVGELMSLVGVPGGNLVGMAAEKLKAAGEVSQQGSEALKADAQSLSDLKRELRESLRELERPVLVAIDDIDRLSAGEMALIFQLVKATADFPNFTYLLLFQRSLVEASLEKVAPGSGRDYLEKIVQMPLDVPALEQGQLLSPFLEGLDRLFGEWKITVPLEDQHYLGDLLQGDYRAGGLKSYLVTLRDVRRLLNALEFSLPLMLDKDGALEVHSVDLIALEMLRLFEPDVYHRLPDAKHILTQEYHDPPEVVARRAVSNVWDTPSRPLPEDNRKVLMRSILSEAPEAHQDRLKEILKLMFPPGAWVFDEHRRHDSMRFSLWSRQMRVCHGRYFDRYFQRAIDPRDISGAEFRRAFALTSDRRAFLEQLRHFQQRAGLLPAFLSDFEDHLEEVPAAHILPLITAFLDFGEELPEEPIVFMMPLPPMEWAIYRIIHALLNREKVLAARGQLCRRAFEPADGLYLPVKLLAIEEYFDQRNDLQEPMGSEEDRRAMRELCVEKIRAAAASGALKRDRRIGHILRAWADWDDSGAPQQWARELTDSKEGLLMFLKTFLGESYTMGHRGRPEHRETSYNLKTVDRFIQSETLALQVAAVDPQSLTPDEEEAVNVFLAAVERRKQGASEDDEETAMDEVPPSLPGEPSKTDEGTDEE
jgi:predicted KAP-like P-loop ATPase